MKKILFLIIAVCIAANGFAAGKIVTDSIQSKTLKAQVKYNVYLPDGYQKDGKVKYPILYLLHGLYGDYATWSNYWINYVADKLIESGELDKLIIIMPNAGGKDVHHIHNGYFNVPGWNYEDFFFNELMPTAEKKYQVIGDKKHRAVSGLSMGGGGTCTYGLKHPDKFSSCYIMSGWLSLQDPAQGNIYKTDCPEPQRKDCKSDYQYYTYKAVWDNRPVPYLQQATPEQIKAWKTIHWFIDCGDDDFLLEPNVDFHLAMRKIKVKSELRVRDGIHNREYWLSALYNMLPFITRGFRE